MRWPVMSWKEHASKIRMQAESTVALYASASEESPAIISSAASMMVFVASSVAATMASSSWPALGSFSP
jgi:hypothetical protein